MEKRFGQSSPQVGLPLNNEIGYSRSERLANTSPESILVAAHELSHWVVGHHFGYLGDISMSPDGNSRARTSFDGYIPYERLSYMLGAGAVDTPHSSAFGYGMDKFMIEYLAPNTGLDFESAKNGARAILQSYDFNVLKRAAEIIGFLGNKGGNISGETITAILERAKLELHLEGEAVDMNKKIKHLERQAVEEQNEVKKTIIEDKGGVLVVKYVRNDDDEEVIYLCRICGGIDGNHDQTRHQGKVEERKENKVQEFKNTPVFRRIPEIEMLIKQQELV